MGEWKKTSLGELLEPKGYIRGPFGSSLLRGEMKTNGIPVYEQKNAIYNSREFRFFIDEEKFEQLKRFQVRTNDLIISCSGTFGKISVIKEEDPKGIISQALLILRPDVKKVFLDYLYYFLSSKMGLELISQVSHGSVQINIAERKVVESIPLLLPTLPEQQSITSILSSLDDKIDFLHRQNKTLEALAETLFRQWFIEERPQPSHNPSQREGNIKADESWEEKTLGEILTITSSKRIYYSEYVSFGVPFYRSKEIIELHNAGSTDSELFISEERFNEIQEKFGAPREGDILMTSVGTLGVTYRVRKDDKFYFKDGNLTWFKDFKLLPSSIIYLWLNSIIGKEQLASITIGSTQEALTIVGLKSISFKVPPRDKLEIYKNEFESILNKIEFNQNQIRTLTQLRDTLLPKLMSGEIRVKNV
ncbi:MAG: restriction endonuclease subunit S [Ignavibacterium sp.]|jgi:type I restriction enzyme S subunit|nr:restriction endonuclease subunit S [Ignavibacterium sp.]